MRLLKASTLEIEEFAYSQIPKYAILSHKWGKDEVSFQDAQGGVLTRQGVDKEGFNKVQLFSSLVRSDGFEYAWIDTCCIDRTSSAELSEAINSMYLWYFKAERCYAYLADVRSPEDMLESTWFRRGWTLQELLAPSEVHFFGEDWTFLGTKETLQQDLSRRTGIPVDILSGRDDVETASTAQRMSWAAKRETTRLEDRAYCLMGLFGINMPLLYGEGERAFTRLQEEIMRISADHSLFAWESADRRGGLLATSPAAFERANRIVQFNPSDSPASLAVSSRGVHLELRFIGIGPRGLGLAVLDCKREGEDTPIAIYVRDSSLTMERFERVRSGELKRLELGKYRLSQYPMRRMCIQTGRVSPVRASKCSRARDSTAQHDVYDDETLLELMNFAEPTALLQAAQAGLEDSVWLLLTRGDVKVNLRDEAGRTALSHAVARCHKAVVKILLPRSHVEAEDDAGRTPLSWAAGQGHEAIGKQLLEKGADIEAEDNSGRTPLSWAAGQGHEAVVRQLIEEGADIEVKDRNGWTPLSWAAGFGHEAVAKQLLEKGADIEARDKNGWTPLLWASGKGHEAVVKQLLENGADIEAKDKNGWTPLLWAAGFAHEAVVKQLLKKGADIEAKDSKYGWTPLLRVAGKGHEAVVKQLLKKGADIEARDKNGWTPLLWAAGKGHEAVVKQLLEKGADIEAKDKNSQTPLWWTVKKRYKGIIKLLLKKGADIEAKDNNGQTPLLWAVKERKKSIVKLLERGAGVNADNEDSSDSDCSSILANP